MARFRTSCVSAAKLSRRMFTSASPLRAFICSGFGLARQRTLDFVAVRVQFFVKNVHVLT